MSVDAPETVLQRLQVIKKEAKDYFDSIHKYLPEDEGYDSDRDYWEELSKPLQKKAMKIAGQLAKLAQQTGPAIRRSPLLTEADEREAGQAFKGMRAALRFQEFLHVDTDVLHDEGYVLGVHPAHEVLTDIIPPDAEGLFEKWESSLSDRLELANPLPAEGMDVSLTEAKPIAAGYRPNTAFIMMWISDDQPELTDVSNAIKECFLKFGIEAVRSDDIEHEDIITQRIIDEIKTAEFLIADLTGERPSVYYEVGFAHALGRRVALYRKKGTEIHFDLAAYNCPEYKNLTELRKMLMRRLEGLTGRIPAKQ